MWLIWNKLNKVAPNDFMPRKKLADVSESTFKVLRFSLSAAVHTGDTPATRKGGPGNCGYIGRELSGGVPNTELVSGGVTKPGQGPRLALRGILKEALSALRANGREAALAPNAGESIPSTLKQPY